MHAYLIVLAMGPGMRPREFMSTEALKDPIEKLSCHGPLACGEFALHRCELFSSYHTKSECVPTPQFISSQPTAGFSHVLLLGLR